MATKVRWAHIYDKKTGKYVGFMANAKEALAWVKKQPDRDLEVTDRRPVRKPTAVPITDAALTAALTATRKKKAEEADHDDDQT